jgi:hypothetical protein
MLKGKDIICFAGEDWWYHNPHSNLHIMQSFAKHNRVLFVNSIGIRMPSMGKDKFFWKKVGGKLRSMMRYLKKGQENIWVLTPFALPILAKYEKLITAINNKLIIFQMNIVLALLKFKNPIIWVTLPTVKDVAIYLRRKKAKCLVYYCVDNVSHFAEANQYVIAEMDVALQKASDISFFVNHDMVQERAGLNPRTYFLSHGVDFEHFHKACIKGLPVPDDIASIKQPIIGYIGMIRDIDFDLIQFLAGANPEFSFVFLGDVYDELAYSKKFKNIHFLGKKPYSILPNYIQNFAVNCLYYKTGDKFNDYRNPKKLLEYFGTGIPVVSVKIREMDKFEGLVYVAKDKEQFNSLLYEALKEDPALRQKRVDFASVHTWDDVSAEAGRRILEVI